ncbi:MAG: heparan-alpha-glucosaminide N-acetyltransferase domain-containing protein [Candidatus Krumholzibacteriia bacterium]|nr:DUF1624 domain-containing protein [Candidatus Latescibacterota bacterium]MCB9517094.1 DUF1624 domain-containing protein [Candidatus Latescibacterota bacterium]
MAVKERFHFIDQFRGLIGIMMALGHSNEYFNHIWYAFEFQDPFFGSGSQFGLRYMGYLCAPGFLVMNGAMVYWAYMRRRKAGVSDWKARWHFIQRGLFLIAVQMTWVNSAWSGFGSWRPLHWSIIACIGTAMILLTLVINWHWKWRLALGTALIFGQHFLLQIPYDYDKWMHVPMQMFIDAGSFNLYPALPWFALALLGSVMAHFWFEGWKTHAERSTKSMVIGLALVGLAVLLRLGRGYGNLTPWSDVFSWSFFLEQKYPPNTVHLLWFGGAVIFMVGLFCRIGMHSNVLKPLGVIGKVPLFFYALHIPLLAIFTRRLGFFYREGAVIASFVGWIGLLVVMFPLALWFGKVKRRSKNWFIQMI